MVEPSYHQNQQLVKTINNCQICPRIDFRKQKLTDLDVEIIVKQAIINKKCSMLWLTSNHLTSKGISILFSALKK